MKKRKEKTIAHLFWLEHTPDDLGDEEFVPNEIMKKNILQFADIYTINEEDIIHLIGLGYGYINLTRLRVVIEELVECGELERQTTGTIPNINIYKPGPKRRNENE